MNILSGEPLKAFKEYLVVEQEHQLARHEVAEFRSSSPISVGPGIGVTVAFTVLSGLWFLVLPVWLAIAALFVPVILAGVVFVMSPRLTFNITGKIDALEKKVSKLDYKSADAFRHFINVANAALSTRDELYLNQERVFHWKHPYQVSVTETLTSEQDDKSKLKNTYDLRIIDGIPCLMDGKGEILTHNYDSMGKASLIDDDGKILVTNPETLRIIRETV